MLNIHNFHIYFLLQFTETQVNHRVRKDRKYRITLCCSLILTFIEFITWHCGKDFPDAEELLEYDDYKNTPTKANASSFITLALEQNWNRVQSTEGYAKYIATRPRAERLGSHGLFGNTDGMTARMSRTTAWVV